MKVMQHPRVKQLLANYYTLEQRDRLALNALGVFFAILFVYFGLWSPAYEYRQESLEYRDRQFTLLQYMRATEQRARTVESGSGQPAVAGQNLLTRVSRTAQQHQIRPNRLQPEGEGSVSVWFDQVPFNDLIAWLEQLVVQQGIEVRQISIDREDRAGMVNVRLVLGG